MSQQYRDVTNREMGTKQTLNRWIRDYSKQMVRCPTCSERLSLEEYVHEHASKRHGWDRYRVCIFCSAEESWPGRKRNFKHIVPCLKRFLIGKVPMGEPLVKGSKPCDRCQKFRSRPRDMCGREKDFAYEGLYESWYERPEEYGESTITFTEESGLGRDKI